MSATPAIRAFGTTVTPDTTAIHSMAVAENRLKPAFYLGDVGWLAHLVYPRRAAHVADHRYVIAHSGSVGAGAWRELFQRVCKLFNDFKCGEWLSG